MNLDTATYRALMAVAYLASNEPVSAKAIAKECGLPLTPLLKHLQQLVRAGVLSSERGPKGGFQIAMPVDELTVLDVVQAIRGPSMFTHLPLMPLGLTWLETANLDTFNSRINALWSDMLATCRDTLGAVRIVDALLDQKRESK